MGTATRASGRILEGKDYVVKGVTSYAGFRFRKRLRRGNRYFILRNALAIDHTATFRDIGAGAPRNQNAIGHEPGIWGFVTST